MRLNDGRARFLRMQIVFIIVALVAGTFNAIEAGTNSALRKALGAPLWSVAVIALMTLVLAAFAAIMSGERFPSSGQIAAVPWWGWTGGLLGLGFVAAMVFTAESLGAGLFIGLTVTASTIGSILLDHYGLIGFDRHPAGLGRMAGGILMVTGVFLIARF